MSLQVIQICDACARKRELDSPAKSTIGGWREIDSGNKDVTLCNYCVGVLIEYVRTRVFRRSAEDDLNQNPTTLTFWDAPKGDQ